jgi:hypothetical protein
MLKTTIKMKKTYIQPSTTLRQVNNLKGLCEEIIVGGKSTDGFVKQNRNELDSKDDKYSTEYGNLW